MNADLARRAHGLLQRALELEDSTRTRFIAAECAGDAVLQARVADLLDAIHRSGEFLEAPAARRGREATVRSPFEQPDVVRNYRILRVIGVGGMATVYEAVQQQPRRIVALKVLRHGLAHTSAVQRFQFETEVLARLQHPGIAQIFDAGAHVDAHGVSLPYLVMEYIPDARTITAYANQCGLPLRERLTLFAAVCDAVQHGHQNGVIHRDLKPGNILMDAHGRPKVIDFGIARSSDPALAWITQDASPGQLVGTLHYMSPEQCSAGGNVDIRADVYSLGVVLYELVCGRLPHNLTGIPVHEALRIIETASPPRPAAIDRRLAGDLDAIISRAIEKTPDRRYPTAAAFAADVRRHLKSEPIEARPPTVMYRCTRFVRRHAILVSAAAVVCVAVVGGAALSAAFAIQTWRESREREAAEARAIAERDTARRHAYSANISGAFLALQTDEYQQLRTRLAQAPEALRGWEWRFLSGMAERSQRTIAAHDDMIFAFAASPDGASLVTGCRDGSIRIWNSSTVACTAHIDGTPESAILGVAFSPDGKRVVSGASDGTVRIWDTSTSQQHCLLGGHDTRVMSVSWSRDGRIASAAEDGSTRLWDGDSGVLQGRIPDQPGGIHGVLFSGDGSRLLTWGPGGAIWLRGADDLEPRQRWSFGGEVHSAVFSADGVLVAAGGEAGRLTLWSTASGDLVREFSIPTSVATQRSLAFSPGGDRLAVGQIHRAIVLWSVATGECLGTLRGHGEAVSGLWFTPDGDRLYSSSWDRTIRIWGLDADSATLPVQTLTGHEDQVIGLAFSPDGTLLASGGRDRTVRLWDPELGLPLPVLRGHGDAVYAVAFAPDGRRIASGSHDHTVRLWSATTGAQLDTLEGHTDKVWTVAFSPDGKLLASAGDDTTVQLWDSASGQPVRTLRGHTARVIRVAFSPDGTQLVSTSRDHSVRLWETATGKLVHNLRKHQADVFAAVFSHDGQRLYTGSRDQTVLVWDTRTGQCLHVLAGHGQFVTCLALSPDETRLAAGSWFGEIVLWDLGTHEMVASFKGHDHAIRGVAFDPGGRWLASASYDRTVRLSDAASPEERRAARLHARERHDAAGRILERLSVEHPDLSRLADAVDATTGLDSETRAWLRKLVLVKSAKVVEQP